MGYNFAGGSDGDQVFLMPPDPREWLPPGHLAWAVRRVVAGLDLAPFLAAYRADGQGNTAYHPAMMTGLVLYCYCQGVRSSRAIEMATWDDVGTRVICGGLHPDHSTNARFVGRHEEPLKGLLVASLVACARECLVRVDITAGDGTKVKASASMAANVTVEQLDLDIAEQEKLIAAEVQAWIAQARAEDAAEDALCGGNGPGRGGGPGTLVRTAGKLARRQQARARLAAEAAAAQQDAEQARQDKAARLEARARRRRAVAAALAAQADARVAATSAAPRRRPSLDQRRDRTGGSRSAARTARRSAGPARPRQRQTRTSPPHGPPRRRPQSRPGR